MEYLEKRSEHLTHIKEVYHLEMKDLNFGGRTRGEVRDHILPPFVSLTLMLCD